MVSNLRSMSKAAIGCPLVGLQRNGTIWVAEGTDDTMSGKPSKERKWKILSLGQSLNLRCGIACDATLTLVVAPINVSRSLDLACTRALT
jgi:hypothetical protein